MRHFLLVILIFTVAIANAQTKILFDATKAQTSGTADWVIDADGSKYGINKLPTPDQSTVTSTTAETYWTGALSSWGIDCVNKGYHVESLPSSGKITYGDKTNLQDLSNYKVYIVDEPNILFTSTEKTAILNFVKNGGGLFIISDHAGSDRNNDGSDSPTIWDDLFTNNGVVNNPFGISFDVTNPNAKLYPSDITEVSSNVSKTSNPITNGTFGTVTKISYSRGTTMVLDPTANGTVKGVVFASQSTSSLNGVMVAYAKYGKGKIVAIGDSSPIDDGTGYTNTGLYVSYANDSKVGNNHRNFCMNSTIWLATTDSTLPVKFIGINGVNKNNITTINWQMNETGTGANYQIEKSANGVDYSIVGTIKQKTNANNAIQNYQWQTQESINTKTYYRIKAIDNDNNVTYSSVVTINPTSGKHISIYPNPVNPNKGFTISGLNAGSSITVTDIRGAVYLQATATSTSFVCNSSNNKTKPMTAGLYIITIKEADSITTEKLVISK